LPDRELQGFISDTGKANGLVFQENRDLNNELPLGIGYGSNIGSHKEYTGKNDGITSLDVNNLSLEGPVLRRILVSLDGITVTARQENKAQEQAGSE
jgi:hypothetical protein